MIISFKKSAKENLFQPVDVLPLGIFRFLFGFLLCIEFLVLSRETFPYYYIEPRFHFTYPLFDLLGLKPLPKPFLWLIFNVLQISTVGIMLGLLTRFFFFRVQIFVFFCFGGLAKLNADWLIHAAPLYLNLVKHFSFLGYPLQEKWLAVFLCWGGVFSY